jgi:hypothetical protein
MLGELYLKIKGKKGRGDPCAFIDSIEYCGVFMQQNVIQQRT